MSRRLVLAPVAALLVAVATTAAADAVAYRPIRRITVPANGGQLGTALATVGDRLLVGAPNAGPGSQGPHAFLIDPATGAVVLDVTFQDFDTTAGEFSVGALGGDLLLGASSGDADAHTGIVTLFDGASGAALRTFCCPGALATGAGGGVLIAGAGAGLYDPVTGELLETYAFPDPNGNGAKSIAVIGDVIAVAARNPVGITLFDAASGAAIGFLGTRHGSERQFGYAMAARGPVLAVSENPEVDLFDVEQGLVLATLRDPRRNVGAHYYGASLAWADDRLAVGSLSLESLDSPLRDAGVVHVYDTASGDLVASLDGDDPAAAFGIAVAGLGRAIAVGAPGSDASSVVVFSPCGDGVVDAPVEECDDGNTQDGDGCDGLCRRESGVTCGDADGDGRITVSDGVQTLRAAAGLTSTCTPARCDVDASGTIGVSDGVNVLRAAAGLPLGGDCR